MACGTAAACDHTPHYQPPSQIRSHSVSKWSCFLELSSLLAALGLEPIADVQGFADSLMEILQTFGVQDSAGDRCGRVVGSYMGGMKERETLTSEKGGVL